MITPDQPREIRDFALRVVASESLEEKLAPAPDGLSDERPGPAYRAPGPGRPPST